MSNQSEFNKLSAKIFSRLYDSFPIGVELTENDFPDFNFSSDLFRSTITFYEDEKFLRYKKDYYGGYIGVVLTSKGFSVLNAAPPEQFASKSNFADALKGAIKTGKEAVINSIVSEFIKLAVIMTLGCLGPK